MKRKPLGLKDKIRAATRSLETDLIRDALDLCDGNITHAAKVLKVSRKSLQLKMKAYGLRE